MILYNTTFILEASARPQPFMDWAVRRYIPAALASPGVTGHILARIDNSADEGTRSYALQFTVDDETALALWETTTAGMREDLEAIYGKGHVLWFSTAMDIISHSK